MDVNARVQMADYDVCGWGWSVLWDNRDISGRIQRTRNIYSISSSIFAYYCEHRAHHHRVIFVPQRGYAMCLSAVAHSHACYTPYTSLIISTQCSALRVSRHNINGRYVVVVVASCAKIASHAKHSHFWWFCIKMCVRVSRSSSLYALYQLA